MTCPDCNSDNTIKHGKDRNGCQRYRCKDCGRTVTDLPARSPIHPMRIPVERAVMVLNLLVEGMSIRAAERVTGTHRDTICRLLVLAGQKCETLLAELVQGVEVDNVEADELWAFIGMKERTRAKLRIETPNVGDSYTFLALDADSKLILSHHVGRRTAAHTDLFVEKLDRATSGRFQITTDGFRPYPDAVDYHLGTRTDFATLVKDYGTDGDERRYSPPRIIATTKTVQHGTPDPAKICTSHVERVNLDVRMKTRRFTRLTNAFSKKWENHRAAVALFVAHYNLSKMHSSIRMTPAMKAGVTNRIWGMGDLLAAA
jgi:transposase-like protein/IS1 family transposase